MMDGITRLKLHTYFIGIALLIVGSLASGAIIGGILMFLRSIGLSPDEQFAWLRPTLIWAAIIVIVSGSTAFIDDMTSDLGESNLGFVLLWPLTIAGISVIGNFIVSASLFDISDVYTVTISLITLFVIKREVIIAPLKRIF